MQVKRFEFNAFRENTYVLYDDSLECVIIDAGCSTEKEVETLSNFISANILKPKYLLNTHAHIDHVLGNIYINQLYGLVPSFHKEDLFLYQSSEDVAQMYGIEYSFLEPPYSFLETNEDVVFGYSKLKCIYAPGHSPGSICFYNEKSGILISGDVLFRESIGRTDLPGGNHQQLLANISEKLLVLPDDTVVYPGHMSETTIGHEKMYNPFF